MKQGSFLRVVLIILAASIFTVNAFGADTIKIGINVPLTGFAASDGESALNGAQLAVDQVNSEGGINGKMVELVVYDDQAQPKFSVPIATKLIEKDKVVVGISCSYSGASRAAAGIFQAAKVPYIAAYAVHPDITKAGNYVFRTSFMGEVQGRAGAKLAGEDLGLKNAVLITLNNDFGQSLAAGFKEKAGKYGVKIINEYSYAISDRQFGPIIARIRADKPNVIYATGYFFTAAPLITQLRAAGIKAVVIGQEGFDSQTFIDIAGESAEGVIITTSLDRDSSTSETRNFIREYENKYNHKTDMVAASSHTAVMVAVEAMKKAGCTDKDAIRAAIAQTNIRVSTGNISFNRLGEVRKDVQVQVVRNGEFRHHSVISDSVLLAPPEY